jgi:hypothetical protein
VIDSQGELIRELTLDPSRNYQPIAVSRSKHDLVAPVET